MTAMSHEAAIDKPRIAIVVLNYNGLALTRRCLESLKELTYPRYETVVVDNASCDESRKAIVVEFPGIHFLALDENRGFTGGNNAAIQWCLKQDRFDAILLLNNDTIVDPHFLDVLVPHAVAGRIAAPQIRSVREPSRACGLVGTWDWRRGLVLNTLGARTIDPSKAEPVPVDFAAGCCLLVPAAVFRTIGIFDDQFFLYYEDADLLVRAANAGISIIYEPRSLVFHDEAGSSGGSVMSPLRVYYNNRNRIYFMRKHSTGGRFLGFSAYFLAGRIAFVLRYAVRGQWSLLRAMLIGVRDYVIRRMGRW